MRDFRQIRIWESSQDLATQIYEATKSFPGAERFGLTAQMRRAAVSIPSNIAEGAGRSGDREMAYHLGVAAGSASELESQIDLAARLGFLDVGEAIRLRDKVASLRKGIYRFHRRVVT